MTVRHLLLVVLSTFAVVSARKADAAPHDGEWWRGQELTAKYTYAAGLFDGMTVGSNLLAYGMSAEVLVKAVAPATYRDAAKQTVHFAGGQLVESLDRFYSDPRNRSIPVSKATVVFVQSVAGMSRDSLLRMIEEYRKPGC